MENKTVTMAHGAGGKQTSELIDQVFKAHFANKDLTADDAAVLVPPTGKMAVSTDGFIVSPAFFPGGNIGKLSICGTVNDLACMGAKPLYLTCAFVIEEGFPMEKLEEIAAAMEKTAKEAGVHIVSGDTKVAGKGQVDGVFITTTGMGEIEEGVTVGGELAKSGDAIIVTGDIGRHGCTILLEREDFGIDVDVTSDCAPLWGNVKAVMDATHELHVIRDATRGGVGTVLYEIAGQSQVGIRLDASKIPVAPGPVGLMALFVPIQKFDSPPIVGQLYNVTNANFNREPLEGEESVCYIVPTDAEAAKGANWLCVCFVRVDVIPVPNREKKYALMIEDMYSLTSGGGSGDGNLKSDDFDRIKVMDRGEYEALETKDPRTAYFIRG